MYASEPAPTCRTSRGLRPSAASSVTLGTLNFAPPATMWMADDPEHLRLALVDHGAQLRELALLGPAGDSLVEEVLPVARQRPCDEVDRRRHQVGFELPLVDVVGHQRPVVRERGVGRDRQAAV